MINARADNLVAVITVCPCPWQLRRMMPGASRASPMAMAKRTELSSRPWAPAGSAFHLPFTADRPPESPQGTSTKPHIHRKGPGGQWWAYNYYGHLLSSFMCSHDDYKAPYRCSPFPPYRRAISAWGRRAEGCHPREPTRKSVSKHILKQNSNSSEGLRRKTTSDRIMCKGEQS